MYTEMEKEIATLRQQIRELTRRIEDRLENRRYAALAAASLRRSIYRDHIR